MTMSSAGLQQELTLALFPPCLPGSDLHLDLLCSTLSARFRSGAQYMAEMLVYYSIFFESLQILYSRQ